MAIAAGEQQTGGEVRDNDGRLIVVGPGGVAIGGGGGGSDPLSDGTPGGALPSKTLWIAAADGSVLRGLVADASGRLRTVVEGNVSVGNFPASQAVSDGGGSLTVDGTVTANAGTGPWPVTDNGGTLSVDDGAGSLTVDGSVSVSNFPATQPVSLATNTPDVTDRDARILGRTKIHDGTNVASVLNTAPGSDTGQSALAVRVISQLGAGSGGGGSSGTIDAPADNKSPTLAQHVQAFLSCFDGTDWDRVRGDTANGIDVDVTRVQGSVNVADGGGSLTVDGSVGVSSLPALPAGTNNIGDVDVVSLPSLPAGTNNIGNVDVLTLPSLPTGDNTIGRTKLTDGTTVASVDSTLAALLTAGASYTVATGTITTSTSTVTTGDIARAGNVTVTIRGTYAGVTVVFEASDDAGTNWFPVAMVREDTSQSETTVALTANQSQMWTTAAPGFNRLRVRATAWTSGTANVRIMAGTYPFEPNVSNVAKKDAGRQQVLVRWGDFAGTAAVESSLSNYSNAVRGGTALGAGSVYTVSTGKTLRIQQVNIDIKSTGTVINMGFFRIRQAATVANTSPIIWGAELSVPSATTAANASAALSCPIPDGLEVPAGQQITFTWFTTANTCTVSLAIIGYEY